jgi:protein phosphatase
MAGAMTDGTVTLRRRSLVVLCGPAAAGKSTFADEVVWRNRLARTAVVSSDACRLLLCDDTGSVGPAEWPILQPNTFDLFLTFIAMRMAIGRPTLADGVNLHMELRPRLLGLARTQGYPSALAVFHVPLEVCLSRNAQRGRRIPEDQIRAQRRALDEAMPHLAGEGRDQLVVLNDRRRTVPIVMQGPWPVRVGGPPGRVAWCLRPFPVPAASGDRNGQPALAGAWMSQDLTVLLAG